MENLDQAHKDFLTKFYAREHLIPVLTQKIIDAKRRNEKLSILLVDIDHFKKVNDKYGHLCGDEFLKYIASTLRMILEDRGLIFRYGGDEFVVVFFIPHPKQAFFIAEQFNLILRHRPFLYNGRLFKITVSCGLATCPDDAQKAEDLVEKADQALYLSKKCGRNTTIQVSKIKIKKIKLALGMVLKTIFIVVVLLSIVDLVGFKGSFLKGLRTRLPITRLKLIFPRGKADTIIILKNGSVFSGRIITEDENKLSFNIALDRGSYTIDIEKNQISEMKPAGNKGEQR